MKKKSCNPFLLFVFLLIWAVSDLSAKDTVLLKKTKAGPGATEEQADRVYEAFVDAMKKADIADVRLPGCTENCISPLYIITTELRIQDGIIGLYFNIINIQRGLKSNKKRIRVKDLSFEEFLAMIRPEAMKEIITFYEAGSYSGTRVLEKPPNSGDEPAGDDKEAPKKEK